MQEPANPRRKYRFGLYEADPASGELLRQGVRVRLQDQPFRLLVILLENAGDVVSREDLRTRLWPADTYVEFDGSLKAALKRLRDALGDPADNPIFIETLPKRGYRFIAPVADTVADQDKREHPDEAVTPPTAPLSASAASSAPPEPATVEASPTASAPYRKQPDRFVLYGASVLVVVSAVFAVYSVRHRLHPDAASSSAEPSLPARKSVAILGFHNASGRAEDQWLSTAFAEMLSTELASGERLRLIPGEEIANLEISAPWPMTSTLGRDTTARIGTALNSDVLISGSYTSIGPADSRQLRLDVRAQKAATGEVLTQIAQTGGANDIFQVTSEIGARLREKLGVPGISDVEQAGVLASLPLDHDAARFYALGIAKLREYDARAAKDLLEQASAADPKFSLAHAMLARAWSQLGYENRGKEEIKKALDLSIDLPRVERMQVEGDYYASLPDHAKAASTYSALFELFPESVDYGLQLSAAQSAAEHVTQALETIARLRRLPPPASLDPRIDIAEARISSRKADSLKLLDSALAKASAQGKRLLYGRARLDQCMQFIYSAHPEQANVPCQEAYDIFRAAGNDLQAADAIRLMGDQQGGEGHLVQARANYERALKILQGTGEHLKTAVILNNMAIGFTNSGNLDRGEQLFREAKFHFEQAGDKRNAAIGLVNIGDIQYLRGNLPAAGKTYEQVISIQSELENGDPGYALYRLADLNLAQGRVKDAHRGATQAIDSLQAKVFDVDGARTELGSILEAEGDLEGAKKQFQSALDARQARGRTSDVAESQVELSEIELEEGHVAQAEPLLRPAIALFEKEKIDPDSASAYTLLSRVLQAEGKIEDARTAVEKAADLARSTPDPELQWPIVIQRARVETSAAQGTAHNTKQRPALALAIQQLHGVIASAKKLGYYQLECEARLAMAEAEMKTDAGAAKAHADVLTREAHQHGFELIARKAQELAGPAPLANGSPHTSH